LIIFIVFSHIAVLADTRTRVIIASEASADTVLVDGLMIDTIVMEGEKVEIIEGDYGLVDHTVVKGHMPMKLGVIDSLLDWYNACVDLPQDYFTNLDSLVDLRKRYSYEDIAEKFSAQLYTRAIITSTLDSTVSFVIAVNPFVDLYEGMECSDCQGKVNLSINNLQCSLYAIALINYVGAKNNVLSPGQIYHENMLNDPFEIRIEMKNGMPHRYIAVYAIPTAMIKKSND